MPTYAPVSSTVVQTPPVLATLNDYLNKTLIPQGYVDSPVLGLFYGDVGTGSTGTENRSRWSIPGFRKPKMDKSYQGTQVEMILNFEEGSNIQTYRGLGNLNVNIYQGGTKIFTPWSQYTTFIGIARDQDLHNAGSGRQFRLLESQLEQNTRACVERLASDLMSANTDVVEGTQDELVGIRHVVSTSPTTTCHGLNRTTYTPFANQTGTIASFAVNGLDTMVTFDKTIAATNGGRSADVILTTSTILGYYEKQAMAVHRIVGSLNGIDLGVSGVSTFKGIPIMWDPGWAATNMTWLTTADLHTFVEAGSNWDMETYQSPADIAMKGMQRWFFHPAWMHARHETNGVLTVSAA